jgi:hypothetical protein
LEENFSLEELLNENPQKFKKMLIKRKVLEDPKNLEEKIIEKYCDKKDKTFKKVKAIFETI